MDKNIVTVEDPVEYTLKGINQVNVNAKAGLTFASGLRSILRQDPDIVMIGEIRDVVAKLNEEVKKGVTLSEAMAQHKDVFPNLFISMFQAGEVTGNMDIIMLRMASHYEKENRMNNKIKSAMIYPIVLGVVAIVVVGMLLVFVMPTFVQMFKSNGVELPAFTKTLLAVSSAIINDGIIVLLILITVIWAIRHYFKTPSGIFLKDKEKLKIPIITNLNEMIIVSRFTRTLSTYSQRYNTCGWFKFSI